MYVVINTATFSEDMVTKAEMRDRRAGLAAMIEGYSMQLLTVIVTGEYVHGEDHTYLRVPPEFRDSTDRFSQRAEAIRYLRGREPGPVLFLDDDTGMSPEDAYDILQLALDGPEEYAWSFEDTPWYKALLTTYEGREQALCGTAVHGTISKAAISLTDLTTEPFPW